MGEHKLSEKQKRFADYYVETGDSVDSYIRAGYKVKSHDVARAAASRLLSNVNVRGYIDSLIASKDSNRIAKQDEVLEFLTSIMRGEIIERIPLGVGGGEQVLVDNRPSVRDRKSAADSLAKRYGLLTDKVEHSGGMVIIKGEERLED